MAFCFIYKNSDYNLLPIEGIIWRIDYFKIYGAVQECFFCPSYFLSPYFSKYTNDETLKTYFKFIDPPQIKKTKNTSHFGAVSS
jgi:hypothetical protein